MPKTGFWSLGLGIFESWNRIKFKNSSGDPFEERATIVYKSWVAEETFDNEKTKKMEANLQI